jgi:hypothetical protein
MYKYAGFRKEISEDSGSGERSAEEISYLMKGKINDSKEAISSLGRVQDVVAQEQPGIVS